MSGSMRLVWWERTLHNLSLVSASRWVPILFLVAGCVRALILLLSYPPAHGSDFETYFLYAESIGGNASFDRMAYVTPPLYSIFIYLTYHVFGSAHLLIALQFVMSSLVPVLYYLALKPFGALFAVFSAAIILVDPQLGIVFNFTSTEPLYVFLLALLFFAFTYRSEARTAKVWTFADGIPGLTLVLLLLTRSVARYLIVPLAIIFLLRTRNWQRTLVFLGGFAVSLLIYSLISLAVWGRVEGLGSSNYMLDGFLFRNPDLVSETHGANSRMWLEAEQRCYPSRCDTRYGCDIYHEPLICLEDEAGSWDSGVDVVTSAVAETVRQRPLEAAERVLANISSFLALSGRQYGDDPGLPGEAQCQNVGKLASELSQRLLMTKIWGLMLLDYSEPALAELGAILTRIENAFCPTYANVPALRQAVDAVAVRYRTLGRPNPLLWYGIIFALTLLVPWARRYWVVIFTSLSLLLIHALSSAVVFNIQPRYVVVTNPWRALMLTVLMSIVVHLLLSAARSLYRIFRGEPT